MAHVQGFKIGTNCTQKLLKSSTYYQSKELSKRSAFDGKEKGTNRITKTAVRGIIPDSGHT
jgi:hypothetical protein